MILSRLPCAVSSLNRSLAPPTHSSASLRYHVIVRVSARASLAPRRLSWRAISPQDILAERNDLHMRGVNAEPIPTQVVNRQAVSDGPDKCLIRQTVSIPPFVTWPITHTPVRVMACLARRPLPATVSLGRNLLPKSEGECVNLSEHREPPFSVLWGWTLPRYSPACRYVYCIRKEQDDQL